MNKYSSLFSQLLSVFPRLDFERLVRQTGAEFAAKGFSSCFGKLKHLGISQSPKRSTLAYANEHRSWELFQKVFYELLSRCRGEGSRGECPQKASFFAWDCCGFRPRFGGLSAF